MNNVTLNAVERNKIKKFKEEGYIPGILYGGEFKKSVPVKFNRSSIQKVLSRHGAHVKLWVSYKDEKKFGFIKDIQKHPVTHDIRHIDIQLVNQNQEARMQIPIIFSGDEQLKQKDLHFQVHKDVADIYGKVSLMPDSIHVDVSSKEQGDVITMEDLALDPELKLTNEEEIFGVVGQLKIQTIEENTEESDGISVEVSSERDSAEA